MTVNEASRPKPEREAARLIMINGMRLYLRDALSWSIGAEFSAIASSPSLWNEPMVGAEDELDPAKVERAAMALIDTYGPDALRRAIALERTSDAKAVAKAVRREIERMVRGSAG